MGNYTTLKLEVVIDPDCRARVEKLDDWLHQALIYNPEITPDWSYDQVKQVYNLDDGRSITLPIYPSDAHLFFSQRNITGLLGIGKSEKWNAKKPRWSYDRETGVLTINAYYRNYDNQLSLFLDWLSPLVKHVEEGEFNTEYDLEGPRYVNLVNGDLVIDRYSFTR